jgi:nucleotide-binding universal stress UspA family protein
VGVDGSDDSQTALGWAAAQGGGREVEIVALATWRAPILPSDAIGQPALLMDWSDFEIELRRRVDEIIAAVRSEGDSTRLAIVARVEQGRAAHTLIEASRDAELLVVGSQGRGGLSGVVLGSVSRHCATHSAVPVVVVPPETARVPIRRFVVGFDGSRNARAALRWAFAFASPEAQIEVVGAVELAPWMEEDDVRARFPRESAHAVAEFESALEALDPEGRARWTFKLQDPRQALAEASEGADIAVLGARGRRRFAATLLGSVSSWMLHGASRPTAIVPDPEK